MSIEALPLSNHPFIKKIVSNFYAIAHWVLPHYVQAAFGLTSSYLLNVNLKTIKFSSSIDISAWKLKYGIVIYMVGIM